jgi:hypothetical protein
LLPAGDMHDHDQTFMKWAASYDDGPTSMRSRRSHEEWLSRLPCPVLRVDGSLAVPVLTDQLTWRLTVT